MEQPTFFSEPRFSRLSQLTTRYDLSVPTLYRLARRDKTFPKPRLLPTGSKLWSVAELDAYFDALGTYQVGTDNAKRGKR
jgi:predicted DNA-binding transcriptional regulator AlpA